MILALVAGPGITATAEPPGPEDRCPVCGMFVQPHEYWVATVLFEDAEQLYFDGPKDLFRFLHDPQKYGRAFDTITEILVTDYYTTELTKAREAFFVIGSDVMGPMGHELVALRSKSDAETFARDHGGQAILEFDEVSEEQLPK
jgi:copper chaperone NosL